MQPANDESVNSEQSLAVALHARYLLALKGHRRGAFISGFFYGVMTFCCLAFIAWKVFPLLSP